MSAVAPSAAAIIPVRVGSERLPGKALLDLTGQALFLHTWQRAMDAQAFDAVYVATDDDAVAAACRTAGAEVIRTSETPRTGTERCAEALHACDANVIVNIQGDWPEIEPEDLDRLVACLRDTDVATATLAVMLHDEAKIQDPNVVKVVRARDGLAMYFSRQPIPHRRENGYGVLRHIGVYAFQRRTLIDIPSLPSSGLDLAEGLEQLRFLENGIPMRVLDATGSPWGIESRPDYDAFLRREQGRPREQVRQNEST